MDKLGFEEGTGALQRCQPLTYKAFEPSLAIDYLLRSCYIRMDSCLDVYIQVLSYIPKLNYSELEFQNVISIFKDLKRPENIA